MKKIFEKWWNNDNAVFSIINYKKAWRECGNNPRLGVFENHGRRKNGDRCFDVSLIIGYMIFNYCNYDLQNQCKKRG